MISDRAFSCIFGRTAQHPEHSSRTSTLRLIVVAAIVIVVCATVPILVLNR
jgi:hypothetical protein